MVLDESIPMESSSSKPKKVPRRRDHLPEQTFSATGRVLGLLPQLASIAIGASVLGYFIGWRKAQAFHGAIGAEWATQLLTPLQMLMTSIGTLVALSVVVILSVRHLATGGLARTYMYATLGLLGASLVVFGAAGIWEEQLTSTALKVLKSIASYLLVVSAGTSIAELIASLRDNRNRWNSNSVFLLYSIAFIGLTQAPVLTGMELGRDVLESMEEHLPPVTLASTSNAENTKWHLVEPVGPYLLLMSQPQGITSFRLVDPKDIKSIGAHPPRTKKQNNGVRLVSPAFHRQVVRIQT